MNKCEDCPLHRDAISNCVGGKGPATADVMIVGQSPGRHEDLAGVPFIGPAGKFLDAMLADAGYDPGALRITNAVRCRPQYDDDPSPREVDACRRHLRDEILAVQPKIIIALGDTALRALTKTSGIGAKRGTSLPLHKDFGYDAEVWSTWHPAYYLHDRGGNLHLRDVGVADLRRIRASSTPEDPIDYALWDGAPLRGGLIAFDIETIDAEGAIVEHPTQVAVSSREDGTLVTPDVAGMSRALADAQARGAWTVGHNAWEFDVIKLREHHCAAFADGLDTMTLAYLDGEQQPLALESLAVKYLKVRGWKEDGRKDARLGTPEFERYNARDAWYTLQLAEALLEKLGPKRRVLVALLQQLRRALDACSLRGLWIDPAAVEAVRPGFEATIARTVEALRELADDDWQDPAKPSKPTVLHNPRSTDEVARVLAARGIAHLPETPKNGKPSTSRGTLNVYAPGDEYVQELLAFRDAQKAHSTYVKPYAAATRTDDGRVHPYYTIIRTKTNRTSARSPNVQNLDRELHFFAAPPGKVFGKADYGSMEFRIAAWCAREPTILANYARDPLWDPHRYFGSLLYAIPEASVTEDQRQVAKSANFSQVFFGTGQTLVEYGEKLSPPIYLSPEQGDAIHHAWHRTFAFKPWYAEVARCIERDGYVETATGFRRHFGDFRLLPRSAQMAVLRQGINDYVQTLAAHIAYIGLVTMHRWGLPINGFFHDAVSFDFDSQAAYEAAKPWIVEAMTQEPVRILKAHFDTCLSVPLVVKFS